MDDEKVGGINKDIIIDRTNYSQDEIAIIINNNTNPIYISKDNNFKHILKEDIYFLDINDYRFKIKSIKKTELDVIEIKHKKNYLLSTEKIGSFSSSSSGVLGYGLDLI